MDIHMNQVYNMEYIKVIQSQAFICSIFKKLSLLKIILYQYTLYLQTTCRQIENTTQIVHNKIVYKCLHATRFFHQNPPKQMDIYLNQYGTYYRKSSFYKCILKKKRTIPFITLCCLIILFK